MVMGTLALALAAAPPAGAGGPATGCEAEGQAFMAAYAENLVAGDRAAIARRYSAEGAYMNGFSPKEHHALDAITRRYAGNGWTKPDAFAWRDLSYETLGVDACVVTGGFTWTQDGASGEYAYTALLRRENGTWRIRVEHENELPPEPAG